MKTILHNTYGRDWTRHRTASFFFFFCNSTERFSPVKQQLQRINTKRALRSYSVNKAETDASRQKGGKRSETEGPFNRQRCITLPPPVRALPYCPSPRGSACVQGAPTGKHKRHTEEMLEPTEQHVSWCEDPHVYTTKHLVKPQANGWKSLGSFHYLLNCPLCGKKSITVHPATSNCLHVGVSVLSNKVLHQMLRHAENKRATVPLDRRHKSIRTAGKSYNH